MQPRKEYAQWPLTVCIPLLLLAGASWMLSAPIILAQTSPQWDTPIMLEANSGEAQFPRLAADASGAAIAVWAQHDGAAMSIWANRYIAGQGWGMATLIEDNTGDARGPWVAMDGNGNAVVVWSQYDGVYLSIWANRYVAGEGWGTATLIETNPGDADFTRVAMNNGGRAMALWRQTDGSEVSIWASRFVDGDGWGSPTLLETNSGEASETWIAMDNHGNAMAVWRQTDGVDLSIWANRFIVDDGWGVPTLIEHAPGFASFPHVVFESNGNALVVWYQGPDSNNRSIWANHYIVGEGWDSPTLLENNPGSAQGPDVAIDGSDRAIAVWRQFDGVDISIWANRYVPGEGWGGPTLIETNPGEAVRPAVAMDTSGNAVVVWIQFDGTNDSVWANRYMVDEGWESPIVIETHLGDARLPKVAIDSHGQALAVWSQDTGTEINIWANYERRFPTFVDVSEAAGFLRSNLQSSWGAAWGDYDNDGHVDVITLGHNQKETNSFSQLWHNNGDGTFSDVTLEVGLDTRGDSHGGVWSDYDRDGDLDIFIAKGTLKEHSSRNCHELWRNNNDGSFTNIAATADVTGVNHRGRGVSSVDYDNDGDLDFFIVSQRDEPNQGGNLLYRNDGPTSFTNVASMAGLAREGVDELFLNRTAAWADVNLDGVSDVLLAQPCGLFLQKRDTTFTDATIASGISPLPDCFSGSWGDYDNDGDQDLYVTMGSDGAPGILYQNNGDGSFTDVI
jgi:FG-GAP-like repeat